MSSADLRASAAALQAEPPAAELSPSSSQQQLSDAEPTTSPADETDNAHDSSREDVAMETAEDVAVTTPTLGRHDSLKAKKRAMLAALAEKRQETVAQAALNERYNNCLIYLITIHSVFSLVCYLLSCMLSIVLITTRPFQYL